MFKLAKEYNIFTLLLIVILSLITLSCKPVEEDPQEFEKKSKTILLYMEAHNSLSSNGYSNLESIKNGYLPDIDGDYLIIYAHHINEKPKLLRLYKENNKGIIDTIYNFPDINSATTDALKNAMNLTKTMFPSDEFGLILWSHGTGWLPQGYYSNNVVRARSEFTYRNNNYDPLWETPPGGIDPYAHMVKSYGSQKRASDPTTLEIEIPALAASLPFNPDFIIFDACLMAGIEVAYELKDKTKQIVFSPAEVLANGLEYNNMMKYLFASKTDLIGMAQNAYDYYNSQSGDYKSLTISVINTEKLEDVAKAANAVFASYKQNIKSIDIKSIQRYFRYNKAWFFDLNEYIKAICGTDGAALAVNFSKALDNAIEYKATTGRIIDLYINPDKYSGISTFIPYHPDNETLNNYYKKFKWEEAVSQLTENAE